MALAYFSSLAPIIALPSADTVPKTYFDPYFTESNGLSVLFSSYPLCNLADFTSSMFFITEV